MAHTAKNKIFAIATTYISVRNGNRNLPHVFGAIFDLDAQGRATDFTPIDFDGMYMRRLEYHQYGKPWDGTHFAGAEQMLLFPITSETAGLLKEAMGEIAVRIKDPRRPSAPEYVSDDSQCENTSPFYFAGRGLEPYAKMERFGKNPVTPHGTTINVSHCARLSYERPSYSPARAGTNCRDFLQFLLEKIGGVPLSDLAVKGNTMPRADSNDRISDFIKHLVDEEQVYQPQRKGMRLLDMREGRYAYAVSNGTGDITAALNGLPKQTLPDGTQVPLTTFLTEHAKPFYDPRLNDYDLGRRTPTAGHAR